MDLGLAWRRKTAVRFCRGAELAGVAVYLPDSVRQGLRSVAHAGFS